MKYFKNHSFFVTAFSFTAAVYLYPLISMRASFLYGDSFVQFYPWLKCYSEALKNLSFPYWVSSMGSGFPLMAEGQIGGFYPLNMAMFFFLPFRVAYNYSIIVHFLLAGIFTYLYARNLGADQKGGYLAALLFCFGSAYAGCFYNIVTLRTLSWFPLVLLLLDRQILKNSVKYTLSAGVVLGMQLTAGFIQMASYSALFYAAYYMYKMYLAKRNAVETAKQLTIFIFTAFTIALPQLMLSYQLSGYSNRPGAALGFALWGSFLPSGIFGMVFPNSFSWNSHFYIGVLSLLFVLFGLLILKREPALKPVCLLLLLSLFFALGAYNPVYVFLIRITRLYVFRNPSKFLFFGTFALSVLAGCGYSRFFERHIDKERIGAINCFIIFTITASVIFVLTGLSLVIFRDKIISAGDYIVRHFIYKAPHHRYGLEYYLSNVRIMYETLLNKFSFLNVFNIASWASMIVAIILIPGLLKNRLKNFALVVIFADILIFSFFGIGFRGNFRPFSVTDPAQPHMLEKLKTGDKELFRILPFNVQSGKIPNWSIPNANMAYGISSVGCYTPLVSKSYKDLLSGLETVDDALGLKEPDESRLKDYKAIIRLLNVKYIISPGPLHIDFAKEIDSEGGVFLYELEGYMPRVFYTKDIDIFESARSSKGIDIAQYENGLVRLNAVVPSRGYIVISENYYPGWRVYVDEEEKPLIKIKNAIQGVAVEPGKHSIKFVFKPCWRCPEP